MNDILDRFKNVFISQKNSGYLFNIIINKVNQKHNNFKQIINDNMDLYKSNFIDVQNLIFNDYYNGLVRSKISAHSVNLEDVLIQLNQTAVNKFEYIITQDLIRKNYMHQIQQVQDVQLPNEEYGGNDNENNKLKHREKKSKSKSKSKSKNQNVENKNTENRNAKNRNTENKNAENLNMENKITEDKITEDKKTNFINFFSDDGEMIDDKYNYNIKISNLKSIYLESINLLYDMYNITDINNKFYLFEKTNKNLITIPIGFYHIDKLLEIITKMINMTSINQNKDYRYIVYRNKIKNRIYINCDWVKTNVILDDKTKDKTFLNFGIVFVSNNKQNKINYSLNAILGFNKTEYLNNNMYIGENIPIDNIYQNVYFKIFINGKEIERYYTTKQTFSYYDKIYLNTNDIHGNIIDHKPNLLLPYDIEEDIDLNTISFQFNNNPDYPIHLPLNFNIVIGFEYV